jgi:hypothetical protein
MTSRRYTLADLDRLGIPRTEYVISRAISRLDIIASLGWRVATTMPEIPHEYTVRRPDREAAYVTLFNAVARDGVVESYKGREKRYLYPGDGRKYWAMTTELGDSRVINRMRVEDDLDRLRREGLRPEEPDESESDEPA